MQKVEMLKVLSLVGVFLTVASPIVTAAEQTPSEKFEYFRAKAEAGDLDAQNSLAWCYRKGDGTEINLPLAAMWFKRAADKGHTKSQYNLGTMYLLGEGMAKNEEAGAKLIETAANKGLPVAQYFLGLCYKEGWGVKQNLETWERLQASAALNGFTLVPDYSEEENQAVREWTPIYDEARRHYQTGQLAKARVAANDALDLAHSKLREKYWYTVATSELLVDIAIRSEDWPEAHKRFYAMQHAAFNAYYELIEIPKGLKVSQYTLACTKKMSAAKLMPEVSEERLVAINEVLELTKTQYGSGGALEPIYLVLRAEALDKRGEVAKSDDDYARCVSICRKFMASDNDLMCHYLEAQANHFRRAKRHKEEAAVRKEILSFYSADQPANYGYMGARLDLIKSLVMMRVQDGESFKPSTDLPRSESALRRLADAGDPIACFRLSVGLSSGEFKSRVGTDKLDMLPESKLYRQASTAPFMDEWKIRDYLDIKVARRFARLGNGFAQYELAIHLKQLNEPWPRVTGIVNGKEYYDRCFEFTSEAYQLLCQAANAGVPEAIHEIAFLTFYGQYDQTVPAEKTNPFVGQDGNWYRHFHIPGTRDEYTLVQRLRNDPVIVRRDLAKAAHYLKQELVIGDRADAAYYLARIYAQGAPESSDSSFDAIRYPAILPDKVECAAYLYACILSKDNMNRFDAQTMLQNIRLTEEQAEEARTRARQILAMRVRG